MFAQRASSEPSVPWPLLFPSPSVASHDTLGHGYQLGQQAGSTFLPTGNCWDLLPLCSAQGLSPPRSVARRSVRSAGDDAEFLAAAGLHYSLLSAAICYAPSPWGHSGLLCSLGFFLGAAEMPSIQGATHGEALGVLMGLEHTGEPQGFCWPFRKGSGNLLSLVVSHALLGVSAEDGAYKTSLQHTLSREQPSACDSSCCMS